jgi:hypothetical protein
VRRSAPRRVLLLNCRSDFADALASQRKEKPCRADHTRSAADLVARLYEAVDAVEDEDARDSVYKAITAALKVWGPRA